MLRKSSISIMTAWRVASLTVPFRVLIYSQLKLGKLARAIGCLCFIGLFRQSKFPGDPSPATITELLANDCEQARRWELICRQGFTGVGADELLAKLTDFINTQLGREGKKP